MKVGETLIQAVDQNKVNGKSQSEGQINGEEITQIFEKGYSLSNQVRGKRDCIV